ncbi:MAG: sugar phosphate isomerase/epimerase [Clostridia bacterium]|nr:sugar phosphate isomerase/epimerase [Clostridia bacterium]
MKHGIYYAYWEKEWAADYVPYVEKVAKLGFDILEIGGAALPAMNDAQLSELRKAADDNGIEITTGYGPAPAHDVGNPATRPGALEWYKKMFYGMAAVNSKKIGGALYSHWPIDYSQPINKAEDWKYAVEGMKLLSELAMPYGIDLNMESLNRFEGYLINTSEECVKFVKEVDCPNVWVMLDTFHMNIEETDISEAIRTAGKLLGHFHTGECNRMVPGKGRTPWREIGAALREIGYDKTVVMEPFVNMGGQVGSDIKVWRELVPGIDAMTLDRDAKDALSFQRYMLDGTMK